MKTASPWSDWTILYEQGPRSDTWVYRFDHAPHEDGRWHPLNADGAAVYRFHETVIQFVAPLLPIADAEWQRLLAILTTIGPLPVRGAIEIDVQHAKGVFHMFDHPVSSGAVGADFTELTSRQLLRAYLDLNMCDEVEDLSPMQRIPVNGPRPASVRPVAALDHPPMILCLPDGTDCFARWWMPEQQQAAVLYLHGIQSHGGWYEASGAHLARAGFAVLMPDRRGSGRNQQQRGHVEGGPQTWLQDVAYCIGALKARTGFEAVHLVGVSWGGKLAAAAAASGVEGIASLTLIAPGIYPRVDLPMMGKVKVAWSLLAEPQRRFEIPLNDPTLFTANPERIAWVEADDLRLREVTGAFLLASRRLDRVAQRLPESAWRGPVHLLLAEHDRIIDNARTRAWFERLRANEGGLSTTHPTGLTLNEYAGAHHTLEFEPDPEPMRADVAEWLKAILVRRA